MSCIRFRSSDVGETGKRGGRIAVGLHVDGLASIAEGRSIGK